MHLSLQARFRTCILFYCNGVIFLHSGCVMPCFGFTTSKVLVTHQCFCYCWAVFTQCQGLFCFSNHPSSKEVHGELGEDTAGTPHQTEGESYSTWHLAEQTLLGERRRRGGHLELWLRPYFLGNGQTSAWLGSRELIHYFALLARKALPHLLTCLFLNLQGFSVLSFWPSAPPHCRGEMRKCMGFICLSELSHSKTTSLLFFTDFNK